MEAKGWARLGYMPFRPELMGRRPAAAAAAAAAEEEPTPPAAAAAAADDEDEESGALRWLRSFSSRLHLARRLLNQTCSKFTLSVVLDSHT